MKALQTKRPPRPINANPTVLPCNFRSAGRLSNESARTLTSLHEVVARNLMNSLDVYLGTGLEVRLASVEQFTMEEFKTKCVSGGYLLPCTMRSASSTVLIELDNSLMFTVIDLLLGGSGAKPELVRELTEIDEEVMEGVGTLIAQEIERVWQPMGYSLTPGSCVKPSVAHKIFPQTEKVLRIQFDVTVANMTGALYIVFPASVAGNLVRSTRADLSAGPGGARYEPLPSLKARMLESKFSLCGEVPDLRVPVRKLAEIEVGSILLLSSPVADSGKLMLEGRSYFDAVPVRQGNSKAMQLVAKQQIMQAEPRVSEDYSHAV